jgi:hypothetical protein
MALNRRARHDQTRPVLGEVRSRQPMIGAAVHDPKRRFADTDYRTARGLFNHLVGTGEQRRWHRQAERLGGLEVDHKLEAR